MLVEEATLDDMIRLCRSGRIVALGLAQMRGDVGADVVVNQR